ncbi:hypothetical protein B9Z55_006622 [Caenorhabditis nigoni]|uniref:Uncharacterized protein n=1 Tax=Caenorhabditis nigoni TaxID=1611254 RepID=A0A2G5V5X2_9PELO|nr:hypothetical protein B9Z55_006622 [Caenorhabditis nigoni]
MANLFRNLFGHKKSHSKGDDENGNDQMNMERDTSRRSVRPPSSASKSALKGARFQDDSMLPATAAYHTQNSTRVRRGPKSCPPEYVDDEPASSRSYNVDSFRRESREQRRRNNNSQQILPSSSSVVASSSHRNYPSQRWETSEYGSENTSPIGYHRPQQHHHHRRHQEEEEYEEDEETEEEVYKKSMRYQELKRKIRAHYEERLFNYERTQRNDHRQIKELEKEKDDLVKMLLQSNAKLEKEKKKTEYFKRKWQEAEQQIKTQPNNSFSAQFGFPMTPQFPQVYQFAPNNAGGSSHRYSFMGAPMHPISSSNTPTTSGMDTTGGGAGESLAQASDVSYLAPLTATVTSALPNLDISSPAGPSTSNAGITHQASSTFFPDDDDDQDETKNFRDEDIEAPRGSTNTLKHDSIIDSTDFLNDTHLLTLEDAPDSGFSTTPDDEKIKAEKIPVH